jgi:hypothetical protein
MPTIIPSTEVVLAEPATNPKTSVRLSIDGPGGPWRPRRVVWSRAEGCARRSWGRREAPTALFLLFRR